MPVTIARIVLLICCPLIVGRSASVTGVLASLPPGITPAGCDCTLASRPECLSIGARIHIVLVDWICSH